MLVKSEINGNKIHVSDDYLENKLYSKHGCEIKGQGSFEKVLFPVHVKKNMVLRLLGPCDLILIPLLISPKNHFMKEPAAFIKIGD